MVLKPLQNTGTYQQARLGWFTFSSLILNPRERIKQKQSSSCTASARELGRYPGNVETRGTHSGGAGAVGRAVWELLVLVRVGKG